MLLVAAVANMTPVLVKNWSFLNYPVDFKLKFRGFRIFGSHKTFRGLFWGLIFSWYLLSVFVDTFSWDVPYNLGLWIAVGVLGGDLVGSFIKRQCNVAPGAKFFPWDQIDSLIGLVIVLFVFKFSLSLIGIVVVVWFFGHIMFNHLGYYLKIKESKW